MPRATVLMPVYNGAKYLREAIDSILNQTYRDFEFLIINDGSTDSSREIIMSYEDSRIHLVDNEENLGLVRTLNKGLRLCKTEYIFRMDADDVSLPMRFQRQIDFMEVNKDIMVSGTSIEIIDNEGIPEKIVNVLCGTELLQNNRFLLPSPLMHPTVVMRRKIVEKGLFYDEQFKEAEDYEFWLRIQKYYRIDNLTDVLLRYRVTGENKSKKHPKGICEETYKIFSLYSPIYVPYETFNAIIGISHDVNPVFFTYYSYRLFSGMKKRELKACLRYLIQWIRRR